VLKGTFNEDFINAIREKMLWGGFWKIKILKLFFVKSSFWRRRVLFF